ncbi:MAG: GNAT family N-acetyltransferase [Patescibacteria group bacterium]
MKEIKIRKAIQKDLPEIMRVEKNSYSPQLQASREVLGFRLKTFGIWVAEVDGVIRGFFTCVPAELSWPNPNIKEIIKNRNPKYTPWFEIYIKGIKPNTLFVTSTAVETGWQERGIGTALVKYSLSLAKKLNLQYRASALRCEYLKFFKKTKKPIKVFVDEVTKGNIQDRFLGLYLKLGFTLDQPLPNYEPYKGSKDFNIFAYKKVK